ncbi:MAG: hypothetical protein WCB12_00535, partial [Bryobacteraceae bacterium]
YEAEDLTLGRRVALKFCLSGRDDAKLRANLLKEARAASSLSHPNIAHIYPSSLWVTRGHMRPL